jgi:hypothetical protein
MADFTSRAAEVIALVDRFRQMSLALIMPQNNTLTATLTPTELANATAQAGQERASFADKTVEYFTRRQVKFNELIGELARSTSGDRDSREVWRANVSGLQVDALSSLGGLVSGFKPTPLAAELKWKLCSEEEQFNSALFDLGVNGGVGEGWQALALLERATRMMLANSDKEWALLLGKAKEVQAAAAAAVGRLLANLLASPGAGEPAMTNLRKHGFAITQVARDAFVVGRTLEQLRRDAEVAFDDYDRTLDEVPKVVEGWRAAIALAEADIATLKALQAAEIDGLHRVFKEKRQIVQDFAKDPPTKKAVAICDKIAAGCASFPSRLPSSDGMKADAALLFAALDQQLVTLKVTVFDAYETLEEECKGRFLEAVSDDTVEQLGQLNEWNELRARFRAQTHPDTLRKLKERIEDPVTDVDRAITDFVSNVNARSADSDGDKRSFVAYLEKQRGKLAPRYQSCKTGLNRVCDQGIALLEGADLAAVVLREAIGRSLKS